MNQGHYMTAFWTCFLYPSRLHNCQSLQEPSELLARYFFCFGLISRPFESAVFQSLVKKYKAITLPSTVPSSLSNFYHRTGILNLKRDLNAKLCCNKCTKTINLFPHICITYSYIDMLSSGDITSNIIVHQ